MKLTKAKLKQLIKEEIHDTLSEVDLGEESLDLDSSKIQEVIASLPDWLVGSTTNPQQKRDILERVADELEIEYVEGAGDFGF